MLKSIYRYLRFNVRYGLDKPVFIVAAITLAIMFVAVYFGSVSGWLDQSILQFNDTSSELSQQ